MTIKVKPSNNYSNKVDVSMVTGAKAGSGIVGLDVLPKAIFPVSIAPINPEVGSTTTEIKWTATPAREGDVLRFTSGLNISVEAVVEKIVDANTILIGTTLENVPQVTDEFLHMRHITLTLNNLGALVTSSGPMEFVKDAVATQVEEDTVTPANNEALPTRQFVNVDGVQQEVKIDTATPANNQPLPAGLFFIRDGVATPVTKDTATPANTRPIPMELVSTTGLEATFNVTTGDLNIATTHTGANPDSMQIGDGTEILLMTATGEATVHDAEVLAELVTLNAVNFATEAKQDAAIALLTTIAAKDFATETTLAAVDFATEAKQDNIITELQAIKNASIDTVEDYYKRDFAASPLTTAASWVTLRTLTAPIKRISVTNNSGNELLIRNQTTNKSLVVGQGAVFNSPLVGAIAEVVQISALGADATDGIIYINFEG